jgi:hypothetical protein
MKVGNSNQRQIASVEATGRSLLTFLDSEPCRTASNPFRSTQTTKPSPRISPVFELTIEPTQALQTTTTAVTRRAYARHAPAAVVSDLSRSAKL